MDLVKAAFSSPNVRLFGTYSHAGHSYAAKSTVSAAEYLALEVSSVNKAAKLVMQIASELNVDKNNKLGDPASDGKLTLAVGATPTAHAAQTKEEWASIRSKHSITEDQLVGHIELHAGCYTLLDMQQFATGCISMSDCALRVGANIISIYPDRREVLCDAGGLAMSKDTGPIPGFGPVVFSEGGVMEKDHWKLGRMSQEHGILTTDSKSQELKLPEIGEYLQLVPQHACLTAACHTWFLITDDGKTVSEVWEAVKGW